MKIIFNTLVTILSVLVYPYFSAVAPIRFLAVCTGILGAIFVLKQIQGFLFPTASDKLSNAFYTFKRHAYRGLPYSTYKLKERKGVLLQQIDLVEKEYHIEHNRYEETTEAWRKVFA